MKQKTKAPWNIKPGDRILVAGWQGRTLIPATVKSVHAFIGPFTGSRCWQFRFDDPYFPGEGHVLYHGKTGRLPAERVQVPA